MSEDERGVKMTKADRRSLEGRPGRPHADEDALGRALLSNRREAASYLVNPAAGKAGWPLEKPGN